MTDTALSKALRADIATVRQQALARITEMDLLVAALREHIRDLQTERDLLRAELAHLRRAYHLQGSRSLARGLRPQR